MVQVANALSAKLRDPAGEHQCDIIFALTHSRISNDIAFAKSVLALSPAAQASKNIASEHGVDILLGGHDHIYWISKGVTGWEGYDLNTPVEDAKDDQGDVLVVKSGTDFQDLSEITLMLKDTPSGSVRRKVITEIRGKRLSTKGTTPVHAAIKAIYDDEVKYIEESLKEPIGTIEEELDARMSLIRTQESPVANWVSDCIREAYDEALINKGYTGADATFINAGGIRGDRVYAPGTLLLGDLKTMFPYNDSIVVIQVDGKTLWDAAESGLSSWPEWEGRFPAISGFRIEWDSRKEPGNRVLGVWMVEDPDEIGPNGIPFVVDKEPVSRTSDKKYLIVTGEYLANGGDGYTMFKGQPVIITAENGQPANQLVKKYIGGSQFLKRDEQAAESTQVEGGRRAHKARRNVDSTHARKLAPAAYSAVVHNRLGLLDPYQRSRARGHASCCDKGPDCPKCRQYGLVDRRAGARSLLSKESRIAAVSAADEEAQQSLPVIRPFIDGRVKDVSKA
ncbi:flagellar associated protein [Coprinopsis cinerea AmutBmut pab1-1]|nr:flagellar associated protein [Coprinopsis cinerea AmutBmut pab1-1]